MYLNDKGEVTSHLPAIRWLLDAISDAKGGNDHRVFRIENLDLLDTLGLAAPTTVLAILAERDSQQESRRPDGEDKGSLEVLRQIKLADATPEKDARSFRTKCSICVESCNIYSLSLSSRSEPPPLTMSGSPEDMSSELPVTRKISCAM